MPETDVQLFDWFLSYKRRDTQEFVTEVAAELQNRGYRVWFDELVIRPGDSITASIERGLNNSLILALFLSPNYFEGWSEQERRAAFNLFVAFKRKIVPIWYRIEADFVSRMTPLLIDLSAIVISESSKQTVANACDRLSNLLKPKEQQIRLWDHIITALHRRFPDDPNVRIFKAVMENDTTLLQKAIDDGGNVNITDRQVINYYQHAIRLLSLDDVLAKWLILSQGQ